MADTNQILPGYDSMIKVSVNYSYDPLKEALAHIIGLSLCQKGYFFLNKLQSMSPSEYETIGLIKTNSDEIKYLKQTANVMYPHNTFIEQNDRSETTPEKPLNDSDRAISSEEAKSFSLVDSLKSQTSLEKRVFTLEQQLAKFQNLRDSPRKKLGPIETKTELAIQADNLEKQIDEKFFDQFITNTEFQELNKKVNTLLETKTPPGLTKVVGNEIPKIETLKEPTEEAKLRHPKAISTRKVKADSQRTLLANSKELQLINALTLRVKEVEEKIIITRSDIERFDYVKKDQFDELKNILDKKASLYDLKLAINTHDSFNEQLSELQNNFKKIQNSVSVIENEELKKISLKLNSLESKENVIVKNIKDMQDKINDLSIMSIQFNSQDKTCERIIEEKFDQISTEMSEKHEYFKKTITNFTQDFMKISNSVDTKIESKASRDTLTDLENRIYAELDRIAGALTRRFEAFSPSKKSVTDIKAQVKRLSATLRGSPFFPESTEESSFVKRELQIIKE